MSQAPSVRQPPPGSCLRLSGVDWRTYSRLLRAFAERPGIRLTYDRGELEITSPTLEHDDDGRVLGTFVFVLTEELGLPLKHGGSTTLRRRLRRRGIEADECFWIANAHRMAGRRRLAPLLATGPPGRERKPGSRAVPGLDSAAPCGPRHSSCLPLKCCEQCRKGVSHGP
jgi:hypothetical protein